MFSHTIHLLDSEKDFTSVLSNSLKDEVRAKASVVTFVGPGFVIMAQNDKCALKKTLWAYNLNTLRLADALTLKKSVCHIESCSYRADTLLVSLVDNMLVILTIDPETGKMSPMLPYYNGTLDNDYI